MGKVGHLTVGKKFYGNVPFEQDSKFHEVDDAGQFFLDYFNYTREDYPKDEWILHQIYLVSAPGYGKSKVIDYFCHLKANLVGDNFEVFTTDDMLYAFWNIPITKQNIFLIVDDALSKLDSRQSMSQIEDTQELNEIRHILRKRHLKGGVVPENGVIWIIYASQIYTGIDLRARENVDLLIFKTIYKGVMRKHFDEEYIDWLSEANFKARYQHKARYKAFGLCATATGHEFKFDFPLETSFPMQTVLRPPFNFRPLIDIVKDKFPGLAEVDAKSPKAMLKYYCIKNAIKLKAGEVADIIDFAMEEQRIQAEEMTQQPIEQQDLEHFEYIYNCKLSEHREYLYHYIFKIPTKTLIEALGVKQSTLYYRIQKSKRLIGKLKRKEKKRRP